MLRVAASSPDKSVYCHQTSFLLGRLWVISVKVSAPLFLNIIHMYDRAWIQQKVSLTFLCFNIKVTWRKASRYAFKILTPDLNIRMSCSKSIILLKKKGGLLDIHREILFNKTVYNARDTYAMFLKPVSWSTSLKMQVPRLCGLFGLVVPLCVYGFRVGR